MTPEVQELVEAAWEVWADGIVTDRLRRALVVVSHTMPTTPSVPMDLSQVPREELEAFYARNLND